MSNSNSGVCRSDSNAPASFQILVNALFAGLKGINLQVFIDDICVATPTWDSHLIFLEKVFKLLIQANLKLKSSKCLFGCEKVTFLGHVPDQRGIRADPNEVKAISALPALTSVDEVRRVLGLLN